MFAARLAECRQFGICHLQRVKLVELSLSPQASHEIIVDAVAGIERPLERLAAEPAIALCAGPTGLEALAAIAAQAASHLTKNGQLIMEHGSGQADDVALLLARCGFGAIRAHLDFSGKPRVTQGTVHSPQ